MYGYRVAVRATGYESYDCSGKHLPPRESHARYHALIMLCSPAALQPCSSPCKTGSTLVEIMWNLYLAGTSYYCIKTVYRYCTNMEYWYSTGNAMGGTCRDTSDMGDTNFSQHPLFGVLRWLPFPHE